MREISPQNVRIVTNDRWTLQGDLFTGPKPKVAILISAGTGFPRKAYRHLAADLARRGAVVLTYDYRGISEIEDPALADSEIDLPDWGRHDIPAALESLAAAAPGLPLTHVAHSVGGHFIGLMENHHKIARHAFLCVGTGHWGDHNPANWPVEAYFWWGLGAFSLARWGYVRPLGGWGGTALPPKVFRTWRRWSHRRDYHRGDIATVFKPHHFEAVTAPICSWLFTDDRIATARAAEGILATYPNAEKMVIQRHPAEYGLNRIGHEGAIRPVSAPVWSEIWHWLADATPPL